MKSIKLTCIGLCATMLLAGMGGAMAEDAKTAAAQKLNASEIDQLNLAARLIAYGDARHDPILLLAAAKLQKTLSDTSTPASKESLKSEDILERAKKAAKGSKDIVALADDVKAMKTKGPYENRVTEFYRVQNYNNYIYNQRR
jgi:hypothetical protein